MPAYPAALFGVELVVLLVGDEELPLSARLPAEPEVPNGVAVVEGFAAGGAVFEPTWKGFFQGDQLEAVEVPLLQPVRLAIINRTSAQCADEIRMVRCPLKTDGNGPARPSTSLSTR